MLPPELKDVTVGEILEVLAEDCLSANSNIADFFRVRIWLEDGVYLRYRITDEANTRDLFVLPGDMARHSEALLLVAQEFNPTKERWTAAQIDYTLVGEEWEVDCKLEYKDAAESPDAISLGGARRIYRILANLAFCNGSIGASEREVLETVQEYFEIEAEEAESLEQEGRRGHGLRVGSGSAERSYLIGCMLDVAAADGVLDSEERRTLRTFAKAVGLRPRDLEEKLQERFE
jgi:uncharacterized tellurite resistance protein B-like protein